MQQRHHERRTISGQMFDVGQQLLAIPRFVPDMLERIRRWTDLTTVHFLQAGAADRASYPPTLAPAFQDDRHALVAAMSQLAFHTRLCCFASSDHRREAIFVLLVGHARDFCARSPHCDCERSRRARGEAPIDPGEGEHVDPHAATERGGSDPVELRVTNEPGTQGLVRGLIKNQRQWVRWSRVKDHAATASASNGGRH